MKKRIQVDLFLCKKRQHVNKKRLGKLKRNIARYRTNRRQFRYHSKILSLLQNHSPLEPPVLKSAYRCHLPTTFSIIEAPEESLRSIYEFASLARVKRGPRRIHFDHSSLLVADLAAESILDFAVIEYSREHRACRKKTRISGSLPVPKELQTFIRAIGLIKNIGAEHEYLSREESRNLRVFNMRNKNSYGALSLGSPDYKERTVIEFVDHIDQCLLINGRQLSSDGRAKLCEYTGEILANAEDHSGLDDWCVVAYLDNDHIDHICQIAIFNFGASFADTFKDLKPDSFTWKQISPYIDRHKNSGFFSPEWSENDLLTLIALQGSVSTKNVTENDTRGQGTVEMIQFFQDVHRECVKDSSSKAKMAVLSGSTFLFFDGRYQMEKDSSGRLIIAFNNQNDLSIKPDRRCVRGLRGFSFPGTVISIRFPLLMSELKNPS